MKKRESKDIILHGLLLFLLVAVAALTVTVVKQRAKIHDMAILSYHEVGIAQAADAIITHAKFDSNIPTYIYAFEDNGAVRDILATLESAVFQKCDKPSRTPEPTAVYFETEKHTYYIGVVSAKSVVISIDGHSEWYRCSSALSLQEKLDYYQEALRSTD